MMIEADVALGKLKGEPHSANRPIMAHPPVTASDLTLEDFLGTWYCLHYFKQEKT